MLPSLLLTIEIEGYGREGNGQWVTFAVRVVGGCYTILFIYLNMFMCTL